MPGQRVVCQTTWRSEICLFFFAHGRPRVERRAGRTVLNEDARAPPPVFTQDVPKASGHPEAMLVSGRAAAWRAGTCGSSSLLGRL